MGSNQNEPSNQAVIGAIFSEQEIAFDFYSCEEAINRLNDYLDHELKPEERDDVVKHLQICQPCLARFHFEETLLVQMRARVTAMVAPHSLRQRLGSVIRNFVVQTDGH